MTWRQGVAIVVLLFLTTGLVGALAVFDARARGLAAEGRELLSPEAVAVRASAAELIRRGPEFASGTRAFRDVPGVPRARAAIVLHGDWSNVPRYSGIRLASTGVGQALVGSAVPTEHVHGARRVEVAGVSYEVSGSLGLGSNSLLAEDILIVDPSAFAAAAGGRTVLDGPGIASRAAAVFGSGRVEPVDGGANRRTNVDFVTPIVLALGLAVATMASVVAGITMAEYEMDRARIRYLTGQRPASLFLRIVVLATVIAVVTLGIIVATLSGPGSVVGAHVARTVAVQCGVFVLAAVAVTAHRRRSWN